ncbi:MAG: RNA polymerase sigma factor [Gemmataceae bacterium]
MSASPADHDLIRASQAGSVAAFEALVLRYQDRLYHAIVYIVGRPEDAQDVLQEAFVNAYQGISSFKGESEFYTWLFRIAYNAAMSQVRKRKPVVSLEPGIEPSRGAGQGGERSDLEDPAELTSRQESILQVRDALERLSPEHRTVLMLKDLEGYKYEEIAALTGQAIGTVRSRIHRARLELRELLVGIFGEEP